MSTEIDAIVNAVVKILSEELADRDVSLILAGISNRHVHLSVPDIYQLFGEGYEMKPWRELTQKGFYACEETVTLVGPKGAITKVRILGPPREHTQVELQLSDKFALGVDLELRDSGQLGTYPALTIVGPKGAVTNSTGIMAALRHIHMNTKDAEILGLQDGDTVSVETSGVRSVTFHNVKVRLGPAFKTEIHLDIDEANAANLKNGDMVKVIP